MRTQGSFYAINESGSIIIVDDFLQVVPIVWNRNGLFCIIPEAILQNTIDSNKMYDKLNNKITHPKIAIHWSQGIPISNQAGRALIGE